MTQELNCTDDQKAELEALLQSTGDRICDMLDQLLKGDWTDDMGHKAKNNVAMLAMRDVLSDIGEYRAKRLSYSDFDLPE